MDTNENLKAISENEIFSNSIQLCTVPKSGTNYTRFLLANYLNILENSGGGGVNYDDMHSFFIPVTSNLVKNTEQCLRNNKLSESLYRYGYSIITYEHGKSSLVSKGCSPRKIILIYRNPLDQAISMFHYHKLKYGKEGFSKVKNILFMSYVKHYRALGSMKNTSNYRITYENLIRNPDLTLTGLLAFLDLPLDESVIRKAVDFSSRDKIRKMEMERGCSIHTSKHMPTNMSFVRSGQIGQWKAIFTRQDLVESEAFFRSKGFNLFSFDLG